LVDNHKDTKNNPIKQLNSLTANILFYFSIKFKQPLIYAVAIFQRKHTFAKGPDVQAGVVRIAQQRRG
jgi:hypothetical protein